MNQQKIKKSLFIVDGHALAYRSHFAFIKSPLRTSKGEETSAIFGFTSAILRIIKEMNPDYIAIAFDSPFPTFRHAIYPEYKATRAKMPDELRKQLPKIREIVDALNITSFEKQGVEADDLMGSVAVAAKKIGISTYLVTGDKDLFQLVDNDIYVLIPGKAQEKFTVLNRQGVIEKFGAPPEKVRDILALMGDTSDNVPGVPGIGEKTAFSLIEEFGTFDAVFEGKEKITKKKVKENLEHYRDIALLSKKLVTIDCNIDMVFDPESLKIKSFNKEKLRTLFHELEFHSLIEEYGAGEKTISWKWSILSQKEELLDLRNRIIQQGHFVVDTETTGIDPMTADPVGVSIAVDDGYTGYIPVSHQNGQNVTSELFREVFGQIFEDEKIKKCGHNIKYDWIILEKLDLRLKGVDFDTLLASYLLEPGRRQHKLDILSLNYLKHRMIPITDLIGTGSKQLSMFEVNVEKAAEYSTEDAYVTYRLQQILEQELRKQDLLELFQEVEIPLITVLKDMEITGVRIDENFLAQLSGSMEQELLALEKNIHLLAGMEFNINSTKQLQEVLFQKMGIKVVRKTKTGISTDVAVLEKLSEDGYEIATKLLDYRKFAKLKNTYTDALPKMVNRETGRIHASFNQMITTTGRLSSSNPNLQNIPVRTEKGREIRKAFIPRNTGWKIISADYSQIELRIMAHISQDFALVNAFKQDKDIHSATAALVFGIPEDSISQDMRRMAKTVNFGIIYGMSEYGLSSRLGITVSEARHFIDGYYKTYPGVKKYMDDILEKARTQGFVTTMLQRRRYIPEINDSNKQVREFAERAAINMPIQGAAADLIKIAMIKVHDALNKKRLKSSMIMQVHDELVFDVPEDEIEEVKFLIQDIMCNVYLLSVPLKVDIGVGDNWLEAH